MELLLLANWAQEASGPPGKRCFFLARQGLSGTSIGVEWRSGRHKYYDFDRCGGSVLAMLE